MIGPGFWRSTHGPPPTGFRLPPRGVYLPFPTSPRWVSPCPPLTSFPPLVIFLATDFYFPLLSLFQFFFAHPPFLSRCIDAHFWYTLARPLPLLPLHHRSSPLAPPRYRHSIAALPFVIASPSIVVIFTCTYMGFGFCTPLPVFCFSLLSVIRWFLRPWPDYAVSFYLLLSISLHPLVVSTSSSLLIFWPAFLHSARAGR